ncbi:LIC_10705 family lipoprotein [Leptospira sp. FAT2]|uniref:LIC_10705 family lipoprotein n=1 Tax=Leptospira sanjuanensis TaxID=2879643 RepID=UPI001EE92191|nr:LIC_10705 family lipoprotein [Leptospira sanjuanensis]MCG6195330.1 LIC_10705 family lipoprotein [Leptospira sanjuanensis]
MLKRIFILIIACMLSAHCDNLKQEDFDRGTTAGIDNNFLLTYGFFFIAPNLDFNQFCPPTDQIPILEPGTYTRFMQAGDTFIFDNRARLNAGGNPNVASGASEYFTFIIQESAGQNVKLASPYCGNSPEEYKADDDSGLSGQLETLDLRLKIPPLPQRRLGFFSKITAMSGSGNITFTTPTAQDPPQ